MAFHGENDGLQNFLFFLRGIGPGVSGNDDGALEAAAFHALKDHFPGLPAADSRLARQDEPARAPFDLLSRVFQGQEGVPVCEGSPLKDAPIRGPSFHSFLLPRMAV